MRSSAAVNGFALRIGVTRPYRGQRWAYTSVAKRKFPLELSLTAGGIFLVAGLLTYAATGQPWRFPELGALGGFLGGSVGATAYYFLFASRVRKWYLRRLGPPGDEASAVD